jgi:TRAP-type mannitol/chloroaromatic compound transport system permease small subunit
MWLVRMYVPMGSGLMFLQGLSELIKNTNALISKSLTDDKKGENNA